MTAGASLVFESSPAGDNNVCVFPGAKGLSKLNFETYI